MIRQGIARSFPEHLNNEFELDGSIFIADYTNQGIKGKGVRVFEVKPDDIAPFEIQNTSKLSTSVVVFDKNSFTNQRGESLSQCECVLFPKLSSSDSWLLFLELKYSSKPTRNNRNLRKAILQLYKTRTYYFNAKVFTQSNTCYLFASLPLQAEPFTQSILSPPDLQRLKKKHNIIVRLQNSATIKDAALISVV